VDPQNDPQAATSNLGTPNARVEWEARRQHRLQHTAAAPLPGFDEANTVRAVRAATAAAARAERALQILGGQVPEHLAAVGALRGEPPWGVIAGVGSVGGSTDDQGRGSRAVAATVLRWLM